MFSIQSIRVESDENLTTLSFEFFKELSEKGKLPQNEEDNINIETSKLIPKDIYTLNLKRNDKFDMIIKDRYKLINIIYEFLNSKFKILKIYGVEGIGKSISFIYFSYLQNDYTCVCNNGMKLIPNTSRECISGFSLVGYICQKYDLISASYTISCPNGYTPSGDYCNRQVSNEPLINYICPDGYEQVGATCRQDILIDTLR